MQDFLGLISRMRDHRVESEKGLSAKEVAAMEVAIGAPLPPDLATFYKVALPVSYEAVLPPATIGGAGHFPAWREDPVAEVKGWQKWLERAFEFDIEWNAYWHEDFGESRMPLTKQIVVPLLTSARFRLSFHFTHIGVSPPAPMKQGILFCRCGRRMTQSTMV